jgi:HD-GYP domain-containing protein (c-di-GMP phosphodiesterase class II)
MNSVQKHCFGEFARCAVTAVSNGSLYSGDHPQVNRLCQKALIHLNECMEDLPAITFMGIDGAIIFEGEPVEDSIFTGRFAQILKNNGVEHVEVHKGVTPPEIHDFIVRLIKKKGTSGSPVSSAHIRLGKIEVARTQSPAKNLRTQDEKGIADLFDMSGADLERLKEIYQEVQKQKTLRVMGIQEIVSALVEAVKQEADPFMALIPLRNLDEYTFTHSINVCILNLCQAIPLGIEGQYLHDIGIAALLHDIGKLFIPAEVLNKPGKLDEAEWSLIQQHPLKGAQYLIDVPGMPRLASVAAFEHHMKFNYAGYPKISAKWQQNICSQMTTVSDFFDALHTNRSYRSSLDSDQIAAIMMDKSGTDFNPLLVGHFFKILKRVKPEGT